MLVNFFTITPLSLLLIGATIVVTLLSYRQQKIEFAETGLLHGYYPWKIYLFFAPVYEEVLFRGLVLGIFYALQGVWSAVVISSALFGLWHLRNLKYQPLPVTLYQCLYTGVLLGPLFAYVTIATGSIYLAIFLHAMNNYLAPISQRWFKQIRLKI